MSHLRVIRNIVGATGLAVLLASGVGATGAAASNAGMATGTVIIAGQSYAISGPADCAYTESGTIYDVPATVWHAMWSSSRQDGMTHLNANIWQPKRGGDPQVTLSVTVGPATYDIATVKGGRIKGSATARTERRGTGGVLVIDGRTATGQAIVATIACSAFAAPEDNG